MARKKSKPAPTSAPAGQSAPTPGKAASTTPLAALEGPSGRFAWLALFLVLFPVYLTCASYEFGGGLGGDNVVYYLLGKAIATGQGYVDLYLPGNPPHSKYPPVLPLLLAPFHLVSDQPLLAMHLMLIAFNTLAVVLAGMVTAKISGSRRAGLATALLFGLGSRMYLQNLHILSEPPYMFFCYLALLLLPEGKGEPMAPGRVLAIGLAATAAFFSRTMGIAVVGAVVVGLFFNRTTLALKGRRLPAAPVAVAVWVICFVLWFARNKAVGAGGGYLDELLYIDPYRTDLGTIDVAGYLARLWKNAVYYFQQMAAYVVFDLNGSPAIKRAGLLAGYALPALALVGAGITIRRGERAVAAFCAGSIFIVLSWSFNDPRFLAPVWPFLFYYLLVGFNGLGRLAIRRRAWIPAAAVAAVILTFELTQLPGLVRLRFTDLTQPVHPVTVKGLPRPFSEPLINYAKYESAPSIAAHPNVVPQRINFLIVNRVASELTPPGSILLSRKPMYTYLLSGRQCVPFIFSEDPEKQWEYMVKNRVDFIITGVGEEALEPTLNKYPQRFSMVAALTNASYLIRVIR